MYSYKRVLDRFMMELDRDVKSGATKKTKFAIISDFDDTLFDTAQSLRLASNDIKGKGMTRRDLIALPESEKGAIFYRAYTKYHNALKPNSFLIELYRKAKSKGAEIIVVSARGEELRRKTEAMLKKHKIRFRDVFLRARSERHKMEVHEWKTMKIKKLIREFDKAWLFDDSIAVIGSAKENIKTDKLRCFLVGSREIKEVK